MNIPGIIEVVDGRIRVLVDLDFSSLPQYAGNAAALAGGAVLGSTYVNVTTGAFSCVLDSVGGGGENYDGLTPSIYAAPADIGTGSGEDEANAMALTDALLIAVAGDVIGLLPATGVNSYFFTTANTNAVFFQPTNSGTELAPIRIVAKYPALDWPSNPELWSEFRATAPVFSTSILDLNGNRPAFGSASALINHVHWIGAFFDMQYTSSRPSHGIFKAESATGIKMTKFRVNVYAFYGGDLDDDNPICVWGAGADDFEVTFNVFSGGGHTPADGSELVNHNVATMMLYGCHNFNITNNTFDGSNTCVFVKGTTDGGTRFSYGDIRLNLFKDAMTSGVEFADLDAVNDTNLIQNLFVRCGLVPTAIGGETYAISLDRSSQNARNLVIDQNTLVDSGFLSGVNGTAIGVKQDAGNYQNLTVTNNVVYFSTGLADRAFIFGWFGGPIEAVDVVSNYNLWHSADGDANFEEGGTPYSGVAAWNGATGLDANSSATDPGFADAGADDYRRLGADTGSSTGARRGCYITNSELVGAE